MEVLRNLHTSVAEACEVSFDQAYKQLESICALREAEVQEAEKNASLANEARQAAEHKVEELQRETIALRAELGHYEHKAGEIEPPESLLNLADDFRPEQIWHAHQHSPEQLQEVLQKKYTILYEDIQTFARSWSDLKAKVLQHKKKLRHWDKQLERDEFTLLLHGTPVTFHKLERSTFKGADVAATSSHPTSRTQNSRNPQVMQCPSEVANPTWSYSAGTADDTQTGHVGAPVAVSAQPQQDGSQTTVPKGNTASSDSSSDEVQSLPELQTRKRKRVIAAAPIPSTGNGPNRSVRVKDEPLSSSPVHATAQSQGHQLPSTQDLDEVGGTVQTPTKRHRHPGFDREESTTEGHHAGVCSVLPPSRYASQHPAVLQPMDGNARIPRRTHQTSNSKKPRKMDQRPVSLMLMAEDGDFEGCDRPNRKQPQSNVSTVQKLPSKSTVRGVAIQHRLEGLLEGTLPTKVELSPDKTHGSHDLQSQTRDSDRLGKQKLHEDDSTSCLPEVQPEDEPYRSRPLHRLNLSHFKINPAKNKGLDFAYDAVVRRKEDRKCLSGCTRPGCCGEGFRAMARLGGLTNKDSKQKATEDQRILEEYVGDDQSLLSGLDVHDREDLLIEARARVLANRYAKHRHDHQRARTPPGFWRTEMPSTQELESDREAAQRVEREKVEERYREAMRPGGLWTWADE